MIENLSYAEFIPCYDRPDTLFYCDPPYYDCESDYGEGLFAKCDFETLVQLMRQASGKVLLSINDKPAVREIFTGLTQKPVTVTYSVAEKSPAQFGKRERPANPTC
ncbi:DNA adenine methylase, partial [Roseibium sp. RKSG952]|nr:DNA adenine methylase [Roseibium sp. RKSG952]